MIKVRIRVNRTKKLSSTIVPSAWTEMSKALSYVWDTEHYE